MNSNESTNHAYEPFVLGIACILPTVVTYAYFNLVSAAPAAVQQAVYAIGKTVQFGLPALWVGFVLRQRLGWVRRTRRGVTAGLLFGVAAGIGGWLLFQFWLQDSPQLVAATQPIVAKVKGLGIDHPAAIIAVGVFYALVHSLMEEYYWRWFVYRRLGSWVSVPMAIGISSVGFMAHHVLVLNHYFDQSVGLTALLSLAVMIGGVSWAWLYERSNSLLGPWLSHLIIDAAIFTIGYAIVFAK